MICMTLTTIHINIFNISAAVLFKATKCYSISVFPKKGIHLLSEKFTDLGLIHDCLKSDPE
jgi:hypothetical protein